MLPNWNLTSTDLEDMPLIHAAGHADLNRAHAYELLKKQAEWWEPGCASSVDRDPGGPLNPVFYRIVIERLSGRRASSPALESLQSRRTTPTTEEAG